MLIADAFNILSEANLKIASLGEDYVNQINTPKQPKTLKRLIRVRQIYNLLNKFIFLNDDGDAITGTLGQNDAALNRLLLTLKREAQITSFPVIPNPINSFITTIPGSGSSSSFPSPANEGDLLYFHNSTWSLLPRGADGTTLTSSPTTIVWSSAVGNGIPSGGSTGQVLKKNSNTSYDTIWSSLAPSDIGVSSSVAELNILDGVTVGAVNINYLTGLSENLSTSLGNKLSTSLANGSFIVGNGSGVATAVSPTGDVTFNNAGLFAITTSAIINSDINALAAITRSKLAAGTADRLVVNGVGGVMTDAAAITANMVLISSASGIPIASSIPSTTLDYLDATSSIQSQLNERLVVNAGFPVQGDILQFNGTDWVNFAIGTAGQVFTTDGVSAFWGSSAANGLPTGGTTNQILRKIDATNYNTEWHTLELADITDVNTTFTEFNLLSGLTVAASFLNYSGTLTGDIQDQIDLRLTNNLAYHALFIGGPSNTALQVPPGAEGSVFTIVSGHPTWQSPPTPGTFSGPVSSTDNAIVRFNGTAGDSGQNSGVIIDDSDNITGVTSLAVGGIASGQISIANQAAVRFYETGSVNYVAVRASGVMAADYTITLPAAAPGANTFLKYDGANYTWAAGGGGASAFTDLTDVPASYTGEAGKIVAVKGDESGLEFITAGAGTVTSVSGTASRISSTGGATPIIDIDASYVGQTSITTLGTIGAGTWNATNISLGKGGTGATLSAPAADRIFFYDFSATSSAFLSPDGTTVEINATTLRVVANGIGNSQIRQSAALSVVGNSTNGMANVGDISSTSDGDVLWRSGTSLIFGALTKLGTITVGVWSGTTISVAYGGTDADLSATGGAGQYLKQSSSGAAITVGTIPASDISSGAALTKTDDTNVTLTLGGSPTTSLLTATSLTLNWTGTLAYARFVNGAGLSVTGRSVSSSGVQSDIAGTANQVLRVNGAGSSLAFGSIDLAQSATVGSSILAIANGGTGSATFTGWLLASGGTLTGANTITSNTNNQLIWAGASTSTATSQYYQSYSATLTARATTSDALYHTLYSNTFVAGANTQSFQQFRSTPTITLGAFTGATIIGYDWAPTITGTPSTHIGFRSVSGIVLIGGSTPTAGTTLDVQGISGLTTNIARFASTSNTSIIRVDNGGELRFGTSNSPYITSATQGSATTSGSGLRFQADNGGHYFAFTGSGMTNTIFQINGSHSNSTNSVTGQGAKLTMNVTNSTATSVVYNNFLLDGAVNCASGSAIVTMLRIKPTITSITAATFYGLVIEPVSFNGIATASPINTWDIVGSFGANIGSTSADITLDSTYYTIKVDATVANRTITLPAASGCTRRIYCIIKSDVSANTVTIDGNASETISGSTTKVISAQYAGYQIQSDGTNWFIIASF